VEFNNPVSWLILGIFIMGLEIILPGFVIFWFGVGGILTSFCFFIGVIDKPVYGWLLFFVFSVIFLLSWHFYFKKFFRKEIVDDYNDVTLAGLKGIALSNINSNKPGRVRLYKSFHSIKEWDAFSIDDIKEGEEIEVIDADGIKLNVKKVV